MSLHPATTGDDDFSTILGYLPLAIVLAAIIFASVGPAAANNDLANTMCACAFP